MKKQNGITLIALVITIIVLLILAGVSISALTGENGIITKARSAKEETEAAKNEETENLDDLLNYINTNIGCLIKFGLPYSISLGDGYTMSYIFYEDGSIEFLFNGTSQGKEPAGTVKYETNKILDPITGEVGGIVSDDGTQIKMGEDMILILESAICNHSETEICNETSSYSGDIYCIKCEKIVVPGTSNKCPEGANYYVGVTSVATGDYTGATEHYSEGELLFSPQNGDVFVFGDYEYRYNYSYFQGEWKKRTNQNGWGVRVLDDSKNTYGNILESINSEPITSLSATFLYCKSLDNIPEIPSTVYNMEMTFVSCVSLTNIPTLPESVTDMCGTFQNCTGITSVSELPPNVTDLSQIFSGCTNLTNSPEIPTTVTSLNNAFANCTSLTVAPDISNCTNLQFMYSTFYLCESLISYVGSDDADGDFSKYVIPDNVEFLSQTFLGCKYLTDAPVIPNSVEDIDGIFQGCNSLVNPPVIPSSVLQMEHAFFGCTSLIGSITINTNPTLWTGCLYNTGITEILGTTNMATNFLATITSTETNP